MSIQSLVYTTTQNSALPLPWTLEKVFFFVHYIHSSWRYVRYAKIYANSDNYLSLAGGFALNKILGHNGFLGESQLLRMIAQTVHIAYCIFECMEQQAKLIESYNELKIALSASYVFHPKVKWTKATKISATMVNEGVQKGSQYNYQVKKVILCASTFFKDLFLLSMKLLDTIEACSFNLTVQEESISHFFVHGKYCFKKLLDNKDELKEVLNAQKEIVKKILHHSGIQYTFDQMVVAVSRMEKSVNLYSSVSNGVSYVGEKVNGAVTKIL